MTTAGPVEVLPFDPDRDLDVPGLDKLSEQLRNQRPAVLLLAGAAARIDRWSQRTAVALARGLSGRGRRVVLVDLDFADPALHSLLDAPNGEGIGDVFFFGASLEHVALGSDDRRFLLIAAGAYVPDPQAVLEHHSWHRLLGQFEARGDLFLGCAPADAPGVDTLVKTVGSAVVLADEDEMPSILTALPPAIRLLSAYAPPALRITESPPVEEVDASVLALDGIEVVSSPPEPAPVASAPPATGRARPEAEDGPAPGAARPPAEHEVLKRIQVPRDAEREALISDLRARQRAALAHTVVPVAPMANAGPAPADRVRPRPLVLAPADGATSITEPPAGTARPKRMRRRRNQRPFVFGAVGAFVLAAIYGAWQMGRDFEPSPVATQPAAATPAAPAAARGGLTGEPAGEPLPYSVAIEAHQDLPTAVRRVESLTRAAPGTGFYIAPILVDSALYYRIMGGPVRDSAAAADLMKELRAGGHKTGGSDWDIRATPYAFLLAEYELKDQASQRMLELRQIDIPAYVIEVPYTNGPSRYYLYAGAYSGAAEADVMRQLLRTAGLADTLVERTGRAAS